MQPSGSHQRVHEASYCIHCHTHQCQGTAKGLQDVTVTLGVGERQISNRSEAAVALTSEATRAVEAALLAAWIHHRCGILLNGY
jgi:hypothetical protein